MKNKKSKKCSIIILLILAWICSPLLKFLMDKVTPSIFYTLWEPGIQKFLVSHTKLRLGYACKKDLNDCEKVFVFKGPIFVGNSKDFEKNLRLLEINNKEIKSICFESKGGSVPDAIKIAEVINKGGYSACVAEIISYEKDKDNIKNTNSTSFCESACPYILMLNRQPYSIGVENRIGVHSLKGLQFNGREVYEDDGVNKYHMNNKYIHELMSKYSLKYDKDFTENFFKFTSKTSSKNMYFLTIQESIDFINLKFL